MKELIVHIGAPKTGSTFLQRTASERRDELLKHGILYPSATERGGGHHDIAFLVSGGYPEWATGQDRPLSELGALLEQECKNFDGRILLSSENFYLFPAPQKLADFLAEYGLTKDRKTSIVFYARRQDQLFLSWYNQQVKALGFAGTFEDALPEMNWLGDYHAQASAWADVFGTGNIYPRNYNAAMNSQFGLWSDFLSTLGLAKDAIPLQGTPARENISLNRDVLEVQRVVNQLPITTVEKRAFHKDLMALTSESANFFSDAPLLTQKARRTLLESFADSNLGLANDFLENGFEFESLDLQEPEAAVYEGLSQEKVLATLAWLILRRT